MNILNLSVNFHMSMLWKNIQKTYNSIYPGESKFIVFTRKNAGDNSSDTVFDFPILVFSDRVFYFKKISKSFRALQKNAGLLEKCDCIHAHTLFSDGGVAYKLWKKFGIPYVISVRNTDMNTFYKYKPYLRFFADNVMVHAKAIVCLSPVYRDRLLEKVRNPELRKSIAEKIVIIPNGIDDYWFENLGLPHDFDSRAKKIRVITAGEISRNKNQVSVANALSEFEKEGYGVEYLICGSVKDEDFFNQLQGFDFVRYLGKKTKEELIEIYKSCDLFVLASHKETFGLVYAEALTQGLPILYTKGEGFDNQFPNGYVGYSVNSDDVDDIYKGIQRVLANYSKLSKATVEASNKFRIADVVQTFHSLMVL